MYNTLQSIKMRLFADPMIPFESTRGERKEGKKGIRGMVARLERTKDKQVAEMIVMMWKSAASLSFLLSLWFNLLYFCMRVLSALPADYNSGWTC